MNTKVSLFGQIIIKILKIVTILYLLNNKSVKINAMKNTINLEFGISK